MQERRLRTECRNLDLASRVATSDIEQQRKVLVQSLQRTRRITSCPAVDFRSRPVLVQKKHRPAAADAVATASEVAPNNVEDGYVAAGDRSRKFLQPASSLLIPQRLIEDSDDDDAGGRQRKPSKKTKTVSRKTGAADAARAGKAATRHRKSSKEGGSRKTSERLRDRFTTLSLDEWSDGGDKTTKNGRSVVGYSNRETADECSHGDGRRRVNNNAYCRHTVNDNRRHSDAALSRFAENEIDSASEDQKTGKLTANSRARSLDISEITQRNNQQNCCNDGSPMTVKGSEKGSPSMMKKWRNSFDGFVTWTGLKRRRCPFAAMRSLSLQSCNEDAAAEVAVLSAAVGRSYEAVQLSLPAPADEAETNVRLPLGVVHAANGIESIVSSEFTEHRKDERLSYRGYNDITRIRSSKLKDRTTAEKSRASTPSGCFPLAQFSSPRNCHSSDNGCIAWRRGMTAISRSMNEIDRCHDNSLRAAWNGFDNNCRRKPPSTISEAEVDYTTDNWTKNKNKIFKMVERTGEGIGLIDDEKQQSTLRADHDTTRQTVQRRSPTVRGRHRSGSSRTSSYSAVIDTNCSRQQQAVVSKLSSVQMPGTTTPSISSSSSSPLSSSLSYNPVKHQQRRNAAAPIGSRKRSTSFHLYGGGSRRGRKGRPLPMLATVDLRTSERSNSSYSTRSSARPQQQQQQQ
jgi:hypothetical protein